MISLVVMQAGEFRMMLLVAPTVVAQNGWTNAASLTSARYGMATGVIDGKIYVAGGYDGANYLDTLEVYDPTMNTWSALAQCPRPDISHLLTLSAENFMLQAVMTGLLTLPRCLYMTRR